MFVRLLRLLCWIMLGRLSFFFIVVLFSSVVGLYMMLIWFRCENGLLIVLMGRLSCFSLCRLFCLVLIFLCVIFMLFGDVLWKKLIVWFVLLLNIVL